MSRKPDLSSFGCEHRRQLNQRGKQEMPTVVEVIRRPLTIVVLCGMA